MHSDQQTGRSLSFIATHEKAEAKRTFGTSYITRDKNPFRICLFRMFRKYTAAVRLDQSALAGSLCCRARISIDYSSIYLCAVAFLSHHANNIFFMKHTWETLIMFNRCVVTPLLSRIGHHESFFHFIHKYFFFYLRRHTSAILWRILCVCMRERDVIAWSGGISRAFSLVHWLADWCCSETLFVFYNTSKR